MARDSVYDILFEPVDIGPVRAKNRFFQVPHCTGLGYRDPTANAFVRGIKAEGGWAVVCTEQVEIHHSSDITPFIELRIWDDQDIPMLSRMSDKIHEHGALAGIELAYNGLNGPNFYGREVPLAPTGMPVVSFTYDPVSAKTMDKTDIANLRIWHRDAAIRAQRCGFDLVYVYAGHALGFFHHFISRRYNRRCDEYGGSLKNRIRILKEILQDTKEAVGDNCAVPCRISVGELSDSGELDPSEIVDAIGMLAEFPDLWDFCLSGWENDSRTSRFSEEGYQEPFRDQLKPLTSKPVVGVGRYTSPDRMVSLIRKGKLDLIGCARPSIADPFLPVKVMEGRIEDIRECIGCNICVSGDFTMSPIRCTQNPSMGEEWRKGWHPEFIRKKESDKPILIVGAGPAGLESAQMLGKRGYEVTLAEARKDVGGRVLLESNLPGLSAWRRVRDYRIQQLHKLPNVEVYLESELNSGHVLEFDFPRVALATGSRWRSDGMGHQLKEPLKVSDEMEVLSPDDIMDGMLPTGNRVLLWDDDHYYMGNVIAERLIEAGFTVDYLTPASEVATWTRNTLEQFDIQRKLLELDVAVHTGRVVDRIEADHVVASCYFTGRTVKYAANAVVLVTSRTPNDSLYAALSASEDEWLHNGIESVVLLGDAVAPATIAHAVYSGRRFAEELDGEAPSGKVPFLREVAELAILPDSSDR